MINFSETKTYNAKVKFSSLGFKEDNSTIWWQMGFDYEGGKTSMTEKVCLNGPDQIANILNVLDLHQWEEVPRKFARIKVQEGKVLAIGNLIEERWLYIA